MAKRKARRARTTAQVHQQLGVYEQRLTDAMHAFDTLFQQLVRKQALVTRYGKKVEYYRKRIAAAAAAAQSAIPLRHVRRIRIANPLQPHGARTVRHSTVPQHEPPES